MARKLLILPILVSLIAIAAAARIQLDNCFPSQKSAVINAHGISFTQNEDSTSHVRLAAHKHTAAYAPIPTETGEEEITAPAPISGGNQQYILKAVVVMIVLGLISTFANVLFRRFCNCHKIEGPESRNNEEHELRPVRIQSTNPEMPTYEPRPIRGRTFNIELNIFNFSSNISPSLGPP